MVIADHPITAKAHTNIALVKYWGKLNDQLIIPQNDSLSITLDKFYTQTAVQFLPELAADDVIFDGQVLSDDASLRVRTFLNHVRELAGFDYHARVITKNFVPTSAGLASSASGFAALAGAASRAAGLALNQRDLSRLARRGSGSATRSIFGGFVAWQQGHDDATSFAYPIDERPAWDIAVVVLVLTVKQKKVSSRVGMRLAVETSPFYSAWVTASQADFKTVKTAIQNQDFEALGHTSEQNAMRMHALTLSSDPNFTYFNADSIKAMQLVKDLRLQGIVCYFTMDAGPNVKIICQGADAKQIAQHFQAVFGKDQVLITRPGAGISISD
ncbi:diphosphomevalonate decarboxylase [Secundilactobacillus pentosiphilus]|uniref:diphosphomevalonate decarboxylase n=1 Tax=Secundilactobacillus pentosiphilus TaxID=1714682 RepID=A0A1Z5IM61_9LACO|nr:diphosphomevalonate decarboxylase [Secundilactobacillus pentosiphilus]GAX02786.1 diphosphomevalonate decarboxylase [Secundilactobacillus pentosiphilus]